MRFLTLKWASSLALLLGASVLAQQQVFMPGVEFDHTAVHVEAGAPDHQLRVQSELARAWAQDRTVVLSHSEHPEVSLRIKQIGRKEQDYTADADHSSYNDSFCDPTVNSYSGYIDFIDGKSIFFYFFESRNDPAKDPLVAWTNGGPGGSSAIGLFQELGPCRVKVVDGKSAPGPIANATTFNPYSWNAVANTIFVDQPVGVGFSYSRYGVYVGDSETAAIDMLAFVQLFLAAFPQYRKRDFYWTAESYGGRYLPTFGTAIVDHNNALKAQAARAGHKVDQDKLINLKGILIGNGWTSSAKQIPLYYDFVCTKKGGFDPIVSISECKRMEVWKKKCLSWMQEACVDNWNADECATAQTKCSEEMSGPYERTKRNVYNAMDLCPGSEIGDCYEIDTAIAQFLNRAEVREYLGAAPVSEIGNYSKSSMVVHKRFEDTLDIFVDSTGYISGLLERGVRVHVYAGTYDFICNWYGFKRVFWDMEWTGKEKLHAAKLSDWTVDGKRAGDTVTVDNFTWSTVAEAGHFVPYDQPERGLHLFKQWLKGEAL